MNDSADDPSDVTIERTFAAPIEVIWAMWAEPQHFANWYGPSGATIPVADMDVRVGGRRFVVMEMDTPDGAMQMCFVGEYVEVEAPARLVYTESLADADGRPMAPEQMGMPAGTPMETSVIVDLADAGDQTRMTLVHRGVPDDSPGAQGWSMAIDKLEKRVAAS